MESENPTTSSRTHKNKKIYTLVDSAKKVYKKNYEENCEENCEENKEKLTSPEWENCFRELDRRIKEFETDMFFLATFGALKAGKSTLINALAGRYICPVGYGYETTLHCSIILCADEQNPEGLYLYRYTAIGKSCSAEQDAKQQADKARDLLDDYRGIKTWDDISSGLERSERFGFNDRKLAHPTKNDLEAALTEKNLERYPNIVLVEIRVKSPDNSLLKKNVAIIDMPGLDGSVANVQSDPIIRELPMAADFFLYVQSSIAAINNDAANYILDLIHEGKSYIVVFNEILAKYWLSMQEQQCIAAKQQQEARGLRNKFSVNSPDSLLSNCDIRL